MDYSIGIGLAQCYLNLRGYVLDFVKPMASGKIDVYAPAPKPFKLIWKDSDEFLSAFKD